MLFALARGRSPALRAGLLGTAAGILFGLGAALTKTTVSRFDEGVLEVVLDWHLYAMIVVSAAAMWLQQAALQTGALSAAVASSMAFDPLSSIPLGIIIFDEQLHESAVGIGVSVAALGVTLFGLVLLARAKGAAPGPARIDAGGRNPRGRDLARACDVCGGQRIRSSSAGDALPCAPRARRSARGSPADSRAARRVITANVS